MSTGLLYEHGMPYKNRNSKLLEGVWAMGGQRCCVAFLWGSNVRHKRLQPSNIGSSHHELLPWQVGSLGSQIITEEQLTAEPFLSALSAGNKSLENCLMLTVPLPLASKPLGTQSQLCFQHPPT
jgi:hypothetical protein